VLWGEEEDVSEPVTVQKDPDWKTTPATTIRKHPQNGAQT